MKIVSYNVNGIRSAMNKGLISWLSEINSDILCFQEIKAQTDQFDISEFEKLGYYTYWFPSEKKGYSGVAILAKIKPDKVIIGCGNELYDYEGRIIRADFGDITQIAVYIPSGTMGDERQTVKMQFLDFFYNWINEILKERSNLIISGDHNICHEAIDIHDPIRNANVSGFLPEERMWFTDYLEMGLTDSYRYLNPKQVKYSWWSYRARAREKDLGWRIDYNIISNNLMKRIKNADILNDVFHSDHCPVLLEIGE
jgi:exodeoxyribonuclease III